MTDTRNAKTAEELRDALDRYMEHFGDGYPLSIGMKIGTREEIIAKIDECIRTDTPAPQPEYKEGMIY